MGIDAILQKLLGQTSPEESIELSPAPILSPNFPDTLPLCNSASNFKIVSDLPESSSSEGLSLLRSVRLFGEAIPLGQSTSMSNIPFNNVKVNTTSPSQTFTLNNTDSCPVNFTITYPANFNASPAVGSVPAGGSQTIYVTFSPSAKMNYNGSLSITGGFPAVSVSGTGVE